MIYKALSDMSKPTTFTAKHYDKTITIEIDHSDIDLNEVMEVFESLTIAMGFSKDGFRDWVKEMADVYTEEDTEEKETFIKQYEYEQEQSKAKFSDDDVRTIINSWQNPPEPNENLKKAAKQYKANLDFKGYEGDNFEDYQNKND
jgi:hypothetical protein